MKNTVYLASPGPVESIRTDYSSHTFKLHSQVHEDELYAYAWDLAEKILPVGDRLEPTKGQYFDCKYHHPSGLSLEMTPLESKKTTAGCGLLVLPGAIWGSLTAAERRDLIIDIGDWPGFYRTTRWDPQVTVLNPPISIYDVIEEVAAGRLWAARFQSQMAWEKRDKDGGLLEPPTQYFGSPQSNVRLRIYDHGAKHDWQIPSLRVEAQLRKDVADQHFRRLHNRCSTEADVDPLFVCKEEETVKDTLKQHAVLKDTSKWEGRRKPRRWAQEAPEPAWWGEMLDHKADPLTLTHRAELDWDKTMAALMKQYGRKLFLWSSREAMVRGISSAELMDEFRLNCAKELKKGDDALLASAVPEGMKRQARETVRRASAEIARRQEMAE
jgi:hypothetical protein